VVCWYRALGCNREILEEESAGLEESRIGQEVTVRRAAIVASGSVETPIRQKASSPPSTGHARNTYQCSIPDHPAPNHQAHNQTSRNLGPIFGFDATSRIRVSFVPSCQASILIDSSIQLEQLESK